MFIRLLIYILLGVFIYRAVKNWSRGGGSKKMSSTDRTSLRADDVMIQDPQCGVYFAKRDGVSLIDGGQELHFCSEACKEKYLAARKSTL